MSRKVKRQKVSLDSGGVKDLSRQEIEMILRAADDLIMKGGRNMLVKTLKGSRDKKLLSHGMQDNPAYGFYRDLKLEEIGHRVDWMIRRAYLEIRYDYRLPLLVYTKEGWEIEKLTYARECYALYKKDRTRGKNRSIRKLKTVNPQVALEVLRWIAEEGTEKDLAGLQAWEQEAQGQLKKRLNFAIRQISIREAGETADSADKPVRLFIAVPMEGAIRESLVRDMEQLQKAGATGTFQPPENLHMTLAFLGETIPERIPDVLEVLRSIQIPSTMISPWRSGFFGDTLYAGILFSEEGSFMKYVEDLRKALGNKNISFDRKPFKPHVTLVRRCSLVSPVVFTGQDCPLERVCLYRSDQKDGRMVYTELGSASCSSKSPQDTPASVGGGRNAAPNGLVWITLSGSSLRDT